MIKTKNYLIQIKLRNPFIKWFCFKPIGKIKMIRCGFIMVSWMDKREGRNEKIRIK